MAEKYEDKMRLLDSKLAHLTDLQKKKDSRAGTRICILLLTSTYLHSCMLVYEFS